MALPPTTTLQDIQTKVRRLTRTPSTVQLSDYDLNQYINTFVVYDFPEHLRMFNLRTQFTFYANPFQDVYPTDTLSYFGTPTGGITTNPLYDFQNLYITMHPPVYIAGYQSFFSQSREQFFGIYPLTNSIASIGPTGDGSTTSFTGVVNSQQAILPPLSNFSQVVTLLQNNVLFSSVATNGIGLALVDVPLTDTITGNKLPKGNLYVPDALPIGPITTSSPAPNGTINYATGAFTIIFPAAPAAGALINSQTVPQICSLPQALMYYDNQFTLRPVPDQPYAVNFEAYIRPTALLAQNQNPTLNDWWQYISYGAAKKIFEDRMDMESVQMIMPEYKKQEALVQRRTIVQYTNERVATIYTEQVNYGAGSGGWGWANGL